MMNNPTNNPRLPGNGLQIIQIQHGERSLAISRMDDFDAFKKKVCDLFAIPADHEVTLETDTELEGRLVPVTIIHDDLWAMLEDQIRIIRLISKARPYFQSTGNNTVYVKTLGRRISIHGVDFSTHNILNIKAAIRDMEGIPPDQQVLVFDKQLLQEDKELHCYNLTHECTVYVALRLRGGWSWVTHFHDRRETHDPLPRAEPLDPSRFIKENFLCLHYKHRTILTSWNADFVAFKERAVMLLEEATERTVYFFVELAIFGRKKMEVDPETWPLMGGLISEVWISQSVPFPETRNPVPSNPGPIEIASEPVPSNFQQLDSGMGPTRDSLALYKDETQSVPDAPDSSRHVHQATGFVPQHNPIPVTPNNGQVYPYNALNLVQSSNSTDSRPTRSIGKRIRDKWHQLGS